MNVSETCRDNAKLLFPIHPFELFSIMFSNNVQNYIPINLLFLQGAHIPSIHPISFV